MTLADLKNKYPIIRHLTSFKFWGIVFGLGLLAQIALFVKFNSFIFFTGMLFWGVIWYILSLIFRRASSKSKLIIHSVFFTIMLAEIFLRLFGLVATYEEKRYGFYKLNIRPIIQQYWINPECYTGKLESKEFSYDKKCNSLGYRDKEWKWKDMKNKTRILALGDSFTVGDGTHQDSTWLKFFERRLSDTTYYFMNGGVCGSDPVFEVYKLKNTFQKYQPHYVIVSINPSDVEDIIFRGGFERFKSNNEVIFKSPPWWEPLYAASHVLRVFFKLGYNNSLIKESDLRTYENHAYEVIAQAMDSIQTVCHRNASRPVFVFHPTSGDIKLDQNPFCNFIDTLNVENSAAIINLYDYYKKQQVEKNIHKYYWKDDGHHNAKGYELMADGIYEGMRKHQLWTDSIDY